MKIQERILLFFSRAPESEDNVCCNSEWTLDNSLSLLEKAFPNVGDLVYGKRVADFGCGFGYQSIALAQRHACHVVGIDSNQRHLEKAIENAKRYNIPNSKLSFVDKISTSMLNKFDIVISQNSFEHFDKPLLILGFMSGLLNESGKLLITFGPPWLAPYGSHLYYFCKIPWIHILFSEETVMKVRSHFRSDGATRYEDVESGLNKMTVAKFEYIIRSINLKIEYKNYNCVKGIKLLSKIPLLREFIINRLTVILSKSM